MRLRADRVVGHPGPCDLVVHDGTIIGIEPPNPAERPDVVVHEISPGLIDWQVNGVGTDDVWTALLTDDLDAFGRIGSALLDHGVTTWCPTLVSAPLARYGHAFDAFGRLGDPGPGSDRPTSPPTARPVGLHLEGPFLGRAPGAHRTRHIVPIDVDFVAALPPFVRVVTAAAEAFCVDRSVGEAVLDRLTAGRIVTSIGHSRPTRAEYDFVVDRGASAVTHLFNAMSGVHHREPGLATWALTDERLHCGIIADGVHVAPEVITLAFAAAGDRITVVSDQVAVGTDPTVHVVDGAPRRPDGTIAGSVATADRALAVATSAGVDRHVVLRAMSTNPARLLGLDDRGEIGVGRRADLVGFDDRQRLVGVWMDGHRVR